MISKLKAFALSLVLVSFQSIAFASPYESLIVGEWKQVAPITEAEEEFEVIVREGEIEYFSNGRVEGDAIILFSTVSNGSWTFKLEFEGEYRISNRDLTETITDLSVERIGGIPDGEEIAKLFRTEILNESSSSSIILNLTDDLLEIIDPANGARTVF